MPIVTTTATALPHQVLDPCLLGRPVHLLPQFAAQLAEDLAAAMRQPGARRYWDGVQLESVDFVRAPEPGQAGRWLSFACAQGVSAFAIERALLLGVLNHRYGRRADAAAVPPDPALVRVTATEERLAATLGQQLAAVLAARIGANLARAGVAAAPGTPKALPGRSPAKGSWTIGVLLREVQSGHSGHYWLALDQGMMAAVMQGLLPERTRGRAARQSIAPLASSLKVTLDGRLVSKEITLDTLFALKVGDIIPVSMGRAQVLLAESCLFTAAVSEHNGMLCLTSFEDTE
jgi:flagellar motor switch protein FliM